MDETISLELDELQRRYRIMEGDRKSYAEEVQNVVRKQKAQIEKLTKENASLKSELSLQSRAATLGDTGIVSTRMTQLQDAIDAVTRQIEAEKARCEEIDGRIRAVREGVMAERREMGGNNAPQEQNQAIHKQTKVLEHRLHRSLVKFNEAIAANKELREEIDNLRRERVVFDGIYKKLQHELAEKKKKMAEIIEAANVAYEARDRAQASMASLKAAAEREQADFESEWKELGLKLEEDRRRQDFLARERARVLSTEQRGEMSLEEEAALKRAVNKGAWELATQGAARTAGMERVQSYEEAFARIQEATGLADTDELVAKFIESEDKNFKMFKYLNELNAEIEKGEAEISEIKAEMEKFRGQDKGAASQRKRLIKEMQDRAARRSGQGSDGDDQLGGRIARGVDVAHRRQHAHARRHGRRGRLQRVQRARLLRCGRAARQRDARRVHAAAERLEAGGRAGDARGPRRLHRGADDGGRARLGRERRGGAAALARRAARAHAARPRQARECKQEAPGDKGWIRVEARHWQALSARAGDTRGVGDTRGGRGQSRVRASRWKPRRRLSSCSVHALAR